jgi:nicotinate dehydrogenase subunit A
MKLTYTLEVNGQKHQVETEPSTPLLYILRNELLLNGPKFGCGRQQCGACMVLLDGHASPSCMLPVSVVKKQSIVTLEGLEKNNVLHPVQQAFIDEQAAQCGYCVNGMIMASVSLLNENTRPDDKAIHEGLHRCLCRCGIQSRVVRAVKRASGQLPATRSPANKA